MTEEELRTILVNCSLSLFLARLDEEYIKILQRISQDSAEYVIRLHDEAKLAKILTKVYNYFILVDSKYEAPELALLCVEHLYYRCYNTISEQVDRAAKFYNTFGEAAMLLPASIGSDATSGNIEPTDLNDATKTHPAATSDVDWQVSACSLLYLIESIVLKMNGAIEQ